MELNDDFFDTDKVAQELVFPMNDELIDLEVKSHNIKSIERSVDELATICHNLDELLNIQSEVLDSIESSIETSKLRVHDAEIELLESKTHQHNYQYYTMLAGGITICALMGPITVGIKSTMLVISGVVALGVIVS
jgi:hypothetical protein